MAILTRADWGAGPHRAGTIRTPVRDLFLHHTVTPQWTGAAAGRRLQQIARSRGFIDISYSWLVDVRGNEIEGRGWARSGAHTRGFNSTSHAVSLVGNFEAGPLTAPMIRGVVRRCRAHRRFGPGRITRPHSDVSQTACPGRFARAQIGPINRAAAGSAPSPSPGGPLMALSDAEQKELLARVRKLPTLDAVGMKIVETLSPDHRGHGVRVSDLDPTVQEQVRLLVHAHVPEAVRAEIEQLLASGSGD